MNWGIDWPDLLVAWVSGLCLGLLIGAVVSFWCVRNVDIRSIREHSQFPP